MNILMVTNTYLPHVGGVARSVAAFAAEHRRHGHRVMIVAPEFAGASAEEPEVVRVPAIQNFNGSDFSVRLPVPGLLTAALGDFSPDLIHAHHPFLLGDAAVRLAALRNIPLVFTHHTMYEQYTHYVPGDSRTLAKFVIDLTTGYTRFCDAVIAPSDSVAVTLRQRKVEAPVFVIPTGVDVEVFAQGDGERIRREMGIPSSAYVVGHLGRLAEEKNLRFLAAAVARFLRKRRQAHFLLVGQGAAEDAVRAAFKSRGLRDRLHFAGSRSGRDLTDCYHAMNVFAFASLSETQGMVVTEAMAAGLPVVALDASGVREVVRDGVNGRLLKGGTERSFAAALEGIFSSSSERRAELTRAAQRTAEEFSLPRTAERTRQLYQEVLARASIAKSTEDSAWEAASRAIETEWELWANVAHAARRSWSWRRLLRAPLFRPARSLWRAITRLYNLSVRGVP